MLIPAFEFFGINKTQKNKKIKIEQVLKYFLMFFLFFVFILFRSKNYKADSAPVFSEVGVSTPSGIEIVGSDVDAESPSPSSPP